MARGETVSDPHVHNCPRCFEKPLCTDDCTIEHDIDRDRPTGHTVLCDRCESETMPEVVRESFMQRIDAMDETAWPLRDVLAKLVEAVDHLLDVHDCDAHGHEQFIIARDKARELLRGGDNG